jgi:YbbR domain-containing protein
VVPPQDISLVSVSPETAIGTVETINTKEVPVIVALEGERNPNVVLTSFSSVQSVQATGRESILAQVASATAFVNVLEGESSVTLFATDANGQPVSEISLEPTATTVTVTSTPVLHTKTVPLEVSEPDTSLGLENFSVSQTTLQIAGTREQLAGVESVRGVVEFSEEAKAGDYNLLVRPQLPEGVKALETVSATFSLSEVNPLGSREQQNENDIQ